MTDWLLPVLRTASNDFVDLLPYVLAGVLLSEALRYVSWSKLLQRLTAAPTSSIVMATAIGIASPMCTYGTLPIVMTLFGMGVPIATLAVFLIASSLMNPQLFLLTWGGISPAFALYRLAAVILFSLIIGAILLKMHSDGLTNPAMRSETPKADRHKPFGWPTFFKGCLKSAQFIGFYIVIGVLLGAVVQVLLPADRFLTDLKGPEWLMILLGALLGIPFYACGGGSIPLVAAMLDKGLSVGAALAFFIVGPATRVTPLIALAAVIRPRAIVIMVLLLIIYAVGVGLLANQIGLQH